VFDQWAAALRAAGIRAVNGRLLADARAFDAESLGAGWAWDSLPYGYAAPVGALQFDEDVVRLTFAAGASPGDPERIDGASPESGLAIVNRVVTGQAGDRLTYDLYRLPGQHQLEIAGTIPAGTEPFTQTASVDDPGLYFARAALGALGARGIEIRGEAAAAPPGSDAQDGAGARVLATSLSPPLADIATVLMKVSQNLYAETLLKTLGRIDGPGSAARGAEAVKNTLAGWGLDPDGYIQLDGSGLSRYDYLTTDMIVAILRRMYEDPRHRDRFSATLPIEGRLAEDNARAKTGSIANVRALSGYVTTRDGEPLVFSIVANNFRVSASAIDRAVDAAVELLANFRR
jgi:D-alanyl-D-alanine carboxypeptidase/D-alanyl-D-alanine-endopeptidase (penicillin-binding protein 4)